MHALENKLRNKIGEEAKTLSFPALIQELVKQGTINQELVQSLKQVWEFRNEIYASRQTPDEVSKEVQTLLVEINSKL